MNSLNKETLSEQIYQILKEDIINQNIKGGTKLTLKTLKERFNVSSTPIREALAKLTKDNLVTSYSNIGIKVVEFNENDLFELYQFIGELDALAVKFSMTSKHKNTIIEKLSKNIDNNLKCIKDNNLKEADKLSDDFHLIFYEYCGNSRLVDSYKKIFLQLSIFSSTNVLNKKYQENMLEDHKNIYNAVCNNDVDSAIKLMVEHLNNSYKFISSCYKNNYEPSI